MRDLKIKGWREADRKTAIPQAVMSPPIIIIIFFFLPSLSPFLASVDEKGKGRQWRLSRKTTMGKCFWGVIKLLLVQLMFEWQWRKAKL